MSLTIKTNDVTSGRKDEDLHGWLWQLRGEWVKIFILKQALEQFLDNKNHNKIYMSFPCKIFFKLNIYVVVQFYPWFKFYLNPLFWGMVMYDYNEFQKKREIKFKPRVNLNNKMYFLL